MGPSSEPGELTIDHPRRTATNVRAALKGHKTAAVGHSAPKHRELGPSI
jgi:hypothetical protein